MATQIDLTIRIILGGKDAGAAARHLAEAVNDGRLDLVSINLLRDELRHVAGDWRIVRADGSAAEVQP